MEWLAQNWIWLLLAVGFVVVMRRGGVGCGHGSHRSHDGGHGADRGEDASRAESVTDPVSRELIDPRGAVTSVYQGRIYYFATRENRDRFEAAPERYAVASGGNALHEHRRRHGC